jgi:CheY-like chemotaxis protein
MGFFEKFEQYLNDALNHLYDPTYEPPELLLAVLGSPQYKQGVKPAQEAILKAIEHLKPEADVPQNARSRRFYDLLVYRYVQGLTQEKTAELLNLTTRHLRREQQQAIHVLAQHLWEQSHLELPIDDGPSPQETEPSLNSEPDEGPSSWRSQVQEELAALHQTTPGPMANVADASRSAVKLGQVLTAKHGIALTAESVEPGLTVMMHPSVLRQILITAIEKVMQHISSGEIRLLVDENEAGAGIKIIVTGYPASDDSPLHSDFIEETVMAQGGSIETELVDDRLTFKIVLPPADRKIMVLVVDDNADLVNFYRHYTTRTPYQILHVSEGRRLFETLANVTPDIIVLDVMLPDVDGWELLTNLHESPATRSVPVIICSVVKREELASALGATLYLPKPVRRQQFIQALDQVLGRVTGAA